MTREQISLVLVENFYIMGTVEIQADGTINVSGDCGVKQGIDTSPWKGCLPVNFGSVTGKFDCTIGELTSWKELPEQAGVIQLTYDTNFPLLNIFTKKCRPVFIAPSRNKNLIKAANDVSRILQIHQASNDKIKKNMSNAQKDLFDRGYFNNGRFER